MYYLKVLTNVEEVLSDCLFVLYIICLIGNVTRPLYWAWIHKQLTNLCFDLSLVFTGMEYNSRGDQNSVSDEERQWCGWIMELCIEEGGWKDKLKRQTRRRAHWAGETADKRLRDKDGEGGSEGSGCKIYCRSKFWETKQGITVGTIFSQCDT